MPILHHGRKLDGLVYRANKDLEAKALILVCTNVRVYSRADPAINMWYIY